MTTKKVVKSPFLFSHMHDKAKVSTDMATRAANEINQSAAKAIEENYELREAPKVAMNTATTAYTTKDLDNALIASGIKDIAELQAIAARLDKDCSALYQMKHNLVNNKEQTQEVNHTTQYRR